MSMIVFSVPLSLFFFFYILDTDCAVIRKLPIFSTFKDSETYFQIITKITKKDDINDIKNSISIKNKNITTNSTSTSSISISTSSLWVTNHSKQYETVLLSKSSSDNLPENFLNNFYNFFPSEILPPNFIKYNNTNDLLLLKKLKINIINKSEFYRNEFLPIVNHLFHFYPIQTENVIIHMLKNLKNISEEDNDFIILLKNTAFLPSYSHSLDSSISMEPGTISGIFTENSSFQCKSKLFKPSDLFDPESKELSSLLDPTRFPSLPFRRLDLIAELRILGLCSHLEWPDIIKCAYSIAQAGKENDHNNTNENMIGHENGNEKQERNKMNCNDKGELNLTVII